MSNDAGNGSRSGALGHGGIACTAIYPTLPVADVAGTARWYCDKLGFKHRFFYGDPPSHGAVELGQATVHFYTGAPNPDRHWLYFHVEDIDGAYELIRANGVDLPEEPTDHGRCASSI